MRFYVGGYYRYSDHLAEAYIYFKILTMLDPKDVLVVRRAYFAKDALVEVRVNLLYIAKYMADVEEVSRLKGLLVMGR